MSGEEEHGPSDDYADCDCEEEDAPPQGTKDIVDDFLTLKLDQVLSSGQAVDSSEMVHHLILLSEKLLSLSKHYMLRAEHYRSVARRHHYSLAALDKK
jgi:hypothetical protein